MALVIIGVGVLAMVDAQSAFIQSNLWSSHAAAGNFLAQEVREFSRSFTKHDPIRGLDPNVGYIFGLDPGEVVAGDLDDLDDLDGLRFGAAGNMPGPINALGDLIPELRLDGSIKYDAQGDPEPMAGWAQEIIVEKVEPFDTAQVRDDGYFRLVDTGGLPPLGVEEFPVRVTVVVTFTPTGGAEMEMARVGWIVP